MKIHIKPNDGHGIKLWFPTSFLKSKFILNYIIKLNNINENCRIDIEPLIKSLPIIYKTLKKYIKEHGHFTLVDVSSEDSQVIIKI